MNTKLAIKSIVIASVLVVSLAAQGEPIHSHTNAHNHSASAHAPIGIIGDHLHKRGDVMFSYRYMQMTMEGARTGTNALSPEAIATTIPNRFLGSPMQPETLRVVPTKMTAGRHMLGMMYAPNDRLTLIAMTSYLIRDMNHVTFAGREGTTRLGKFSTKSEGLGDTTLAALVGLNTMGSDRFHLNIGISFPTGSIDETDRVLTPTGSTPSLRLPYPMQLGSGTYDFKPGFTYLTRSGKFSWGGQATAVIRLGDNNEGYALGDQYNGNVWASYHWSEALSTSLRFLAKSQRKTSGLDRQIVAPVQTANPDFSGGDSVISAIGTNYLFSQGAFKGHRLAAELSIPLYRNLNGPQLESDWAVTVGWQKAF